jgi:sensor histidine kinase regulating citrate/malate metabolism
MNGARRLRFRAFHIGSVDSDALKIPARRAEYSLTESALSPFQAEPIQQLEAKRKPASEGARLGLALTKRIVEAQGGTVGVRSAPGQGSTFYAVLPNQEID